MLATRRVVQNAPLGNSRDARNIVNAGTVAEAPYTVEGDRKLELHRCLRCRTAAHEDWVVLNEAEDVDKGLRSEPQHLRETVALSGHSGILEGKVEIAGFGKWYTSLEVPGLEDQEEEGVVGGALVEFCHKVLTWPEELPCDYIE